MVSDNNFEIKGLSIENVALSREKFGSNKSVYKKDTGFLEALKAIIKEPMVILLIVASLVYFVSGEIGDGIFLTLAIVIISGISLYQDSRSRNALDKLKSLTQPNCKVIRDGKIEEIKSEELVIGDSLMVEEGTFIAADGVIVHANDFSVNEVMEDDLSKMVAAVAMGRKIYANLKKAIQYIISIHIPIILTVLTPLALGWAYPNIFSPIHIIF